MRPLGRDVYATVHNQVKGAIASCVAATSKMSQEDIDSVTKLIERTNSYKSTFKAKTADIVDTSRDVYTAELNAIPFVPRDNVVWEINDSADGVLAKKKFVSLSADKSLVFVVVLDGICGLFADILPHPVFIFHAIGSSLDTISQKFKRANLAFPINRYAAKSESTLKSLTTIKPTQEMEFVFRPLLNGAL